MKCLHCIIKEDKALAPDQYEMKRDEVAGDAVTVIGGDALCARHLEYLTEIEVRRTP